MKSSYLSDRDFFCGADGYNAHLSFIQRRVYLVCLTSYAVRFWSLSNWWLVELPMWLTYGFLDTFFGRWRGAVRIHVSHVWH